MAYMVRLVFLFFVFQISCGQNKETMKREYYTEKDIVSFNNKPKSGYFLQINSQNCHYKVLVNDLLSTSYTDPYPAYSIRPMMNYEISKSGEQKLSIIVTPIQGEKLTRNADVTIRLMRYADIGVKAESSFTLTIPTKLNRNGDLDVDGYFSGVVFEAWFKISVSIKGDEDENENGEPDIKKQIIDGSPFKTNIKFN